MPESLFGELRGIAEEALSVIGAGIGASFGGPGGALVGGRIGGAIGRGIEGGGSVAPTPQRAAFPAGPSITPQIQPVFQAGAFSAGRVLVQRGAGGLALPRPTPVPRTIPRPGSTMAIPPLEDRGGGTSVVEVNGVICRPVSRHQQIVMFAKQFNPGATARKIVRSAKECGIEITAGTFGLTILDVCFLIGNQPRRRGKGISAANMRNCNRVLRAMERNRKIAKKALNSR